MGGATALREGRSRRPLMGGPDTRSVGTVSVRRVLLGCASVAALALAVPAGAHLGARTRASTRASGGRLRYKLAPGRSLGKLSDPGVRSLGARFEVLPYVPGPRPIVEAPRILSLAEQAARGEGDPRPNLIQHAAGSRFDAVRISSGDLVFDWSWSYLIAVHGHFVALGAPIPPGARPPRGTVITLVLDARTGRVTDAGLSNRYPPLAELGPVSTDLRRGSVTSPER